MARLSKPQLSFQHPLPRQTSEGLPKVDPRAALSYPVDNPDDEFVLSPLVTLPSSFGVLHVGETFSCTLCVNNELSKDGTNVAVNGLRLSAVMQTPSQPDGIPIELRGQPVEGENGIDLTAGETISRIAKFDLREEGTHILQPTVTYNEAYMSPDGTAASGGRVRTFRKLYQFVAQQLLSVRTKAQSIPASDNKGQVEAQYVLEAQIENLGDITIVLEDVRLAPKSYFTSHSLNIWDVPGHQSEPPKKVHLRPGEIQQACFMLKEADEFRGRDPSQTRDGRTILAQLAIDWRGPMGEIGSLSTGWLSTRRR